MFDHFNKVWSELFLCLFQSVGSVLDFVKSSIIEVSVDIVAEVTLRSASNLDDCWVPLFLLGLHKLIHSEGVIAEFLDWNISALGSLHYSQFWNSGNHHGSCIEQVLVLLRKKRNRILAVLVCCRFHN